jgi:hypothetical protein
LAHRPLPGKDRRCLKVNTADLIDMAAGARDACLEGCLGEDGLVSDGLQSKQMKMRLRIYR